MSLELLFMIIRVLLSIAEIILRLLGHWLTGIADLLVEWILRLQRQT